MTGIAKCHKNLKFNLQFSHMIIFHTTKLDICLELSRTTIMNLR